MYQEDASTPDQYEMFNLQTLRGTISAISLPGSEGGRLHSDGQALRMPLVSGPAHLPVSHSLTPEKDSLNQMNDISPLSGSISLKSAALGLSLANRLKRRLEPGGSTIYSMHWKDTATPAERQYCQLVASVRRISAKDCSSEQSGWPTPTTRDHKDGQECPNVPTNSLLGREVWKADRPIRITADGRVLTGSDAGTVSSGQLNPAHSRWLMGYPKAWCEAAFAAWQNTPVRRA